MTDPKINEDGTDIPQARIAQTIPFVSKKLASDP